MLSRAKSKYGGRPLKREGDTNDFRETWAASIAIVKGATRRQSKDN